jgi:FkbM family methyltransferase
MNQTIKVSIKSLDLSFFVREEKSLYNSDFWDKVQNSNYEPDVIFTLKRWVSSNCIFFDIGASTGVMTFIAASLGANCVAYEPIPKWFSELTYNITQNLELAKRITAKQSVVALSENSKVLIRELAGDYISSISYSNKGDDFSSVVNLKNEISSYCKNYQPILKVDIEGAEYKILQDESLLQLLSSKESKMILAIHPGFLRPIKPSKLKFLRLIRKIIFKFRNYIDNYKLFNQLKKYAKVCRTNDVEVNSPHKFSLMAATGVYEYNVCFE